MCTEIVAFDDFAERRCLWFRPDYTTNNGYGCAHPAQEEVEMVAIAARGGNFYGDGADEPGPKCLVPEGRCFTFSCPIGVSLSPHSEPADAVLLREHGFDPDHFEDEHLFLIGEREWPAPAACPT